MTQALDYYNLNDDVSIAIDETARGKFLLINDHTLNEQSVDILLNPLEVRKLYIYIFSNNSVFNIPTELLPK
jgi:hypothetical protein